MIDFLPDRMKRIRPVFIVLVLTLCAGFIPTEGHCLDLFHLKPGMTRGEVEEVLWWESRKAQELREDSIILTLQLIPGIHEQQRTLLKFDDKRRLFSVNLQITPKYNSSGEDIMNLFQDARQWMVDRFGPPAWERREGSAPSEEILDALRSGAIVRVLQWENSTVIRFGIPQRANGEILLEVLMAPIMFPKSSKFWGGGLF